MAMSRADRTLDGLLAKLAEKSSFERLLGQYTRRYRLPREVVADAVQQSFYKVLKFYAGKTSDLQTLEQVERFLHTVIRNTLIDDIRRTDVIRFVELDEDYVATVGSSPRAVSTNDAANPETQLPEDVRPVTATQEEGDDAAIGVGGRGIRRHGPPSLEDTMVEAIDTKTLMREILLQLDPKYRHVAALLLGEWTPDEMNRKFGQNGYRMRVWARVKICRILASMAAVGHELAEQLHAQGGCHRILQSIRGGATPTTA
jgi:DNA-directed RNA polymerase specialized sigma24 family protein